MLKQLMKKCDTVSKKTTLLFNHMVLWLILYVNLAGQWCPDIPWNIVLDVKMILGRDLCLNKYILSKAEWPPHCG